jgi:FG-GAP-like repeat
VLLTVAGLLAVGAVPQVASAAEGCPDPGNPNANYSCPAGPDYLIPALPDAMGWDQPSHYENIVFGDINGDGADEMVARGVAGTEVFRYIAQLGQWSQMAVPAILPDSHGWSAPDRYRTLALGDIDGDGRAELVVRSDKGMLVYRFKSGATADGGRWEQVTDSGPFAGAIWDKPDHYMTIRLMPIGAAAGKKTMQLVGRGPDGLHVFRFNGKDWHALPVLKALSDADGYNRPQYAGAVMSWGANLLFAPGPHGVAVFRYEPATDSWSTVSASGPCAEKPGDSSFPCDADAIRLARGVPGAGGDPVLIARDPRGHAGLRAARWSVSGARWEALSPATENGPWGDKTDGETRYASTIQTADLTGIGQDYVLGRWTGGIAVFRPQISGTTFSLHPVDVRSPQLTGPDWAHAANYSTITTARLFPGSSARYLLARGKLGIRTWAWNVLMNRFQRPIPYGTFPPLKPGALDAMTSFLGIAHGTVRDTYAKVTADPTDAQLRRYEDAIKETCKGLQSANPPRYASCLAPADAAHAGVTSAVWTTTANQILAELSWAQSVVDYFGQLDHIQSRLFLDQTSQFPAIAADLKVATDPTLVAKVDVKELVGTVVGIVAGLPIPGVSHIAGVIGSGLALAAASTPVGEGTAPSESDISFAKLHGKITTLQHEIRDSITRQRRRVLSDYGLLGSVGGMVSSRVWTLDAQAALSAGREGFTLTVYRDYLPALWDRWTVTRCAKGVSGVYFCDRPSPDPLIRQTRVDKGVGPGGPHVWDFDGLFPKQTPCQPFFLLNRQSSCTFKSLDESQFKQTEHVLIDPIAADCKYNPEHHTSWKYGCSLGVSPSLLLAPESSKSEWRFRERRCNWQKGRVNAGCQAAQE